MLDRATRVRRGLVLTGAVFALLMGASLASPAFYHPDLYLEDADTLMPLVFRVVWQTGGLLLFFWIGASIPLARARSLVMRGRLVFGWPIDEADTLGSDILARDHGPTSVVAAGAVMATVAAAMSRTVPSLVQGWLLPWKGKTRWVDVSLFGDEVPLFSADGRGLFLVDPDIWYYPPSPWLFRVEPGAEGEEEMHDFVNRMADREQAQQVLPEARGGSDEATRRARSITRRWVVSLVLLVVVFYLPLFLELGWWLVALMAFIVLVPIFVLGPLIRGVDFSAMIPGKRYEDD